MFVTGRETDGGLKSCRGYRWQIEMNWTSPTTFFFFFFFSSNEQIQNPHGKDRNAIGCTYLSGGNEIVSEENASTRLALI